MTNRNKLLGLIIILITSKAIGQVENECLRLNFNTGITCSNTIGKGIVDSSWINGYPPDCYTNSSASNDFIIGKKFGIGLSRVIDKIFSIGIDINYEEKGCKIPITHISYLINTNGTYKLVEQKIDEKSKIKLKYFVIPIKLETRFKFFYINSGIYTGLMFDSDDYGKLTINNQEIKFKRDNDGRYSLLDFGVLFGTGVSIPIAEKNNIKFGLTGNWNITGNDGRGMTPGYKYHWYNQSFNFEIRFERKIK
jgi:hypothetical protein